MDGNSELTLLPQHAALLAASAIDAEVARERGYASVTAPIDLGRRGFKERQRNVPALLIPIWDVRGRIGLYQARPDTCVVRNPHPALFLRASLAVCRLQRRR